jgi:hypothetical protein
MIVQYALLVCLVVACGIVVGDEHLAKSCEQQDVQDAITALLSVATGVVVK